jgi:hypothetical protein
MEQEFVVSVLKVSTCEAWGGLIWLGAQQMPGLPADQGWSWSTNETWKFTNWSQGEPNDFDGWAEDRLCMYAATGRWNDGTDIVSTYSCNFAAMLEWSADCNNDGIVDYGQCHDGTLPDYNSNNIPDCCERGEACVVGNYPVQWRVEDGGNGHWYSLLLNQSDTWDHSRSIARSLGADLATIISTSEQGFVAGLIRDYQSLGGEATFAIGGVAPIGQGWSSGWSWVDGSAWSYTNWGPSFPNNDGSARRFVWIRGDGFWDDYRDSDAVWPGLKGSVIEWSADCNNDDIVDYGQILQGQLADLNTDGVPDVCQQPTCADADLYANNRIDGADLGILLSEWGPVNPSTNSDINKDGFVNGADLGILLSFWGACPN